MRRDDRTMFWRYTPPAKIEDVLRSDIYEYADCRLHLPQAHFRTEANSPIKNKQNLKTCHPRARDCMNPIAQNLLSYKPLCFLFTFSNFFPNLPTNHSKSPGPTFRDTLAKENCVGGTRQCGTDRISWTLLRFEFLRKEKKVISFIFNPCLNCYNIKC